MSRKPRLVVMAREPRLGRVKTRLAKGIGRVSALRVYRAVLARTFHELSGPEPWDRVAMVTPDRSSAGPAFWPKGWRAWAQGRGDLGARMAKPIRQCGPGPVILVGTDIPDLDKAEIKKAFKLLGHHDAVFGPAPDGGFWLVGFKRTRHIPFRLFQGIAWSRADTLAKTIDSLSGLRIGFVAALNDLDEAKDLKGVMKRL